MTENTVANEKVPARTDDGLPATRESELYLSPAVDIYETADGLTVVADVPGVDRDGLDIDVEDKILTMRGMVTATERPGLLSREYGVMNYFRQFRLSDEVDREKIEASLAHGVLTLRLPKAESAKPRRIQIKA
jgi:HSP20 family protein